jgi:hypothetical protein
MHRVTCTLIDWEPPVDYEIMGGMFHQQVRPSGNVIMNVVGVPDIPTPFGGSVEFMLATNLSFVGPDEGLYLLGKTTRELIYDTVLHTNKLRISLHHPSGMRHGMFVAFEIFKSTMEA